MRTKGFTLIEALVAISIVGLAIGGPMYAANRALVASQIARDKLTAIYLAQEGIEQVRYVRDSRYMALYSISGDTSQAWGLFRGDMVTDPLKNCYAPNVCTVEPTTHAFQQYTPIQTPPKLYINKSSRQYTQSSTGADMSMFTRTIQIQQERGEFLKDKNMEIVATTQWTFHGTSYSVSITDHLTAWQ